MQVLQILFLGSYQVLLIQLDRLEQCEGSPLLKELSNNFTIEPGTSQSTSQSILQSTSQSISQSTSQSILQ